MKIVFQTLLRPRTVFSFILTNSRLMKSILSKVGRRRFPITVTMDLNWIHHYLSRILVDRDVCEVLITLPEAPFPNFCQVPKSCKKNGIMIPALWSGDYRSFINFLYPLSLNTKLNHVNFNGFKDISQTSKSWTKNGIMIPLSIEKGLPKLLQAFMFASMFSELSRGLIFRVYNVNREYLQDEPKPLSHALKQTSPGMSPPSSMVERFIESSNALFVRAVCDHELVLDILKFVFNVESIMVFIRVIHLVASFSNFWSFPSDKSLSLYLYLFVYVFCISSAHALYELPSAEV
ncbi:uncharacterized protein LOC17892842 [Capsella rubella]|nr:uncharacterized protein LOC17892842 [Capsella rubella]